MTVTLEIITSAYRESNLIAIGATPTTAQIAEALSRLNALVSSVYGYEVGEPLGDWPIGVEGVVDYSYDWTSDVWPYPSANVRLIANSTEAQTIYLPPTPSDGARVAIIDPNSRLTAAPVTIDGNGRTIENAANVVLDANGTNRIWLYRAELGNWSLLSTLTGAEGEDFPFPNEFDDYFITKLAMRLNPRYGRSIAQESAVEMDRILEKLRARYRQYKAVLGEDGPAILTRGYGTSRNGAPQVANRSRSGWMV
jgi:hypothetical protein